MCRVDKYSDVLLCVAVCVVLPTLSSVASAFLSKFFSQFEVSEVLILFSISAKYSHH